MRNVINLSAAIAASLLTVQAHATLMLSTGITSSFNGQVTGTNTHNNDYSTAPSWLHFGQLGATSDGVVDFYYVGNEAGYTNSLMLNGGASHSSLGLNDDFSSMSLIGSMNVFADSLLDFGFCTSGGADAGASDRCAWNANSASLTEQFNHGGNVGYRSIGYRPLLDDGAWGSGSQGGYSAWGLFWDDSGARNDDDHDDYVAIARFRANPVSVPEPATSLLLGAGLLGIALSRRRRSQEA